MDVDPTNMLRVTASDGPHTLPHLAEFFALLQGLQDFAGYVVWCDEHGHDPDDSRTKKMWEKNAAAQHQFTVSSLRMDSPISLILNQVHFATMLGFFGILLRNPEQIGAWLPRLKAGRHKGEAESLEMQVRVMKAQHELDQLRQLGGGEIDATPLDD
jgi:hypothetical protein